MSYNVAVQTLGMVSAVLMPFFDIPLILRILSRKSSEDISLIWVFGIEACILGMLPAGLQSPDAILRVFSVVNAALFTAVVVAVLWYHPSIRRSLRRSE